jgi:hypothetical protein
MIRKIILGITFICITVTFNSCETLGACKICRQVTYNISGGVISEGPEAEYCDAALIAIEAKPDQPVGNTIIKWECR